MEWIQENKFVSGLLGLTLAFVGGIFYHGYSEKGEYEENMMQFTELKSRHQSLITAKPYPDAENLEARVQVIEQYEDAIEVVRGAFLEYLPDDQPAPTPGEFSDAKIKMQRELRSRFDKQGTSIPGKCEFGFERYAKKQPAEYATSMLSYQLGAIQWLLEKLADTQPKALVNIHRELLDAEKGPPPVLSEKEKRRRKMLGPSPEDLKIFVEMPVELTFQASESSMRDFLHAMANSKKYLYAIRALRIRSEKQNAPGPKDANFESVQAELNLGAGGAPLQADPFGDGFVFPGDEDAELVEDISSEPQLERSVNSSDNDEHIIKQVLGDENVNVHISFDILLLKGKKPPKEENDTAPSVGGQS